MVKLYMRSRDLEKNLCFDTIESRSVRAVTTEAGLDNVYIVKQYNIRLIEILKNADHSCSAMIFELMMATQTVSHNEFLPRVRLIPFFL